jgi:hypothetical protein
MSASAQHIDQEEFDIEFVDTVAGSATACANLSAKLDTLKGTTAGCLSGPVSYLVEDFSSMSESYSTTKRLLRDRESVWGKNVSLSIRFTQERCQDISTEVFAILGKYGEWDVLATAGSTQHLYQLSYSLVVLKSHHSLLCTLDNLITVLNDKPDECGTLDIIVAPAFPWSYFRARREPVVQAMAQKMNEWSSDYERSLHLVRENIRMLKRNSKLPLEYHILQGSSQRRASEPSTSQEPSTMNDESTTQSTTGIMTPTEEWSDVGSETTEIAHTPAITRHSLQLCGYATAIFLRLMDDIQGSVNAKNTISVDAADVRRLHKAFDESIVHLLHALNAPVPSQSHMFQISSVSSVTNRTLSPCIQETRRFLYKNKIIEESFGHLPGSTPVGAADIEAMHKAYSDLVDTLLFNLAAPIPFQNGRFASTPAPASPGPVSVSVPVPVSEIPRPVTPDIQSNIYIDRSLQAIINSMEPTPTEKDIMKLVFHWTTLEECNGFKRAEVMQLNQPSTQLAFRTGAKN